MATSVGASDVTASTASTAAAPSSAVPVGNVGNTFAASPNRGTLNNYEVAPGGSVTEDPAVAYDTVSAEPIENIYEPLITYNGSTIAGTLPSAYVPVLSTCVPGTSQCAADYPSPGANFGALGAGCGTVDLISYCGGVPYAYTYPIDPTAQFYNSTYNAHWPVYPSDVVFSVARTAAWADIPFEERSNGWILTQALVPGPASPINGANPGWNPTGVSVYGAVNFPLNNTGYNIMSSMLVNDSFYCPTDATQGCVTFDLNGSQSNWPFFQELVADFLGASIVSCGAFTAESSGVPGFAGSSAPHGMGPCTLPNGATSTTSSLFTSYMATLGSNTAGPGNLTSWNSFEELGANYPADQLAQWGTTGSGPYYLSSLQIGTSYSLAFNPDYAQPAGCAGLDGLHAYPGAYCDPATDAGGVCATPTNAPNAPYACDVNVYWEMTDTPGYEALVAGTADFGALYITHTNELVGLATTDQISCTSTGNSCGAPWNGQNKINIGFTGTISNFALMPNFEYNLTAYQTDFSNFPNPSGLSFVNFNPCSPSSPHYSNCGTFPTSFFFSGQAVRAVLSLSYPYTEVQTTQWEQTSGSTTITYLSTYGGPVPFGMNPYYTNGVPFPFLQNGGTPDNNSADNGSAAWWFAAGTATGPFSWAAYPGKADPSAYDPWYDPDLASCLNTTCKFPIESQLGNPAEDNSVDDAIASLQAVSWVGGIHGFASISPFRVDVNFGQGAVGYEASPDAAGSYYFLGWAPDYPDPTDYVPTYIGPNGAFGAANSYQTILNQPQFNVTGGVRGCVHDTGTYADLLYWGSTQDIPEQCQSVAYNLTTEFDNLAGVLNAGGVRTAYYEDIENISNYLNLETWQGQTDGVLTAAPWISIGSLNTNPTIGGGGDALYYEIKYAAPLKIVEAGLPAATHWSAVVGGQTYATGSTSETIGAAAGLNSISVPAVTVGPTTYNAAFTTPTVHSSIGITVPSAGETLTVHFEKTSTVTISETGLLSGTPYTITVHAPATWFASAPAPMTQTAPTNPASFPLVAGAWKITISSSPATDLYSIRNIAPTSPAIFTTGAPETVPNTGAAVNTVLHFGTTIPRATTFTKVGLGAGIDWTITVTAATLANPLLPALTVPFTCPGASPACHTSTPTAGSIILELQEGSYTWAPETPITHGATVYTSTSGQTITVTSTGVYAHHVTPAVVPAADVKTTYTDPPAAVPSGELAVAAVPKE
jgi:hypothetical protein